MLFEKQQYQQDCVSNILEVLKQSSDMRDFDSLPEAVQRLQDIPIKDTQKIPRLDILMETGTGKTFTYIQTMYQLNKDRGVSKFIIFVPRLAIRAGVEQNIDLTSDYFFQIYQKRLKCYRYEGKGTAQVSAYLRDKDELSVLILTGSSVASRKRSSRILTRRNETLGVQDKSLLDAIGKLRPVIFIDEPHLLKGEVFTEAFEDFTGSLCLRFGATFPDKPEHKLSNVVYVLDSLSAFRQHLVKKIRVTTIVDEANAGLRVLEINDSGVKLSYFKENIEYVKYVGLEQDLGTLTGDSRYDGVVIVKTKSKRVYLSSGAPLELYRQDYNLDDESVRRMIRKTIEIHFAREETLFKQGIKTLSLFFIPNVADFRGDNPRIKKIFEEEYIKARNIVIKGDITEEYRAYLAKDYDDEGKLYVHDGYFSGDKGSKEEKEAGGVDLILKDKTRLLSFETPLRFIFSVWALQEGWDNPNIFNICKLAASAQETSRRQQVGRGLRLAVNQQGKRQTLKYCDEDENRFYDINMLDVIVSGWEKNFIIGIQTEIENSSYQGFVGDIMSEDMLARQGLNRKEINELTQFLEIAGAIQFSEGDNAYHIRNSIADALKEGKKYLSKTLLDKYDLLQKIFSAPLQTPVIDSNQVTKMVGIRADNFKEFEALWHCITQKAKITYCGIDDEALIATVINKFNKQKIDKVNMISRTASYNPQDNIIEDITETTLGAVNFFTDKHSYQNFILDFAKSENLPLMFVLKIFTGLKKLSITNNPKRARERLAEIIKDSIHHSVVQTIRYQFDNDIAISPVRDIFYTAKNEPRKTIEAHKIGRFYDNTGEPPRHYLYDKIVYDSKIESQVIKQDNQDVVDFHQIIVFAKLPRIAIPTPYKSYSPDFAYFIKNSHGKKLFLIVETKGYDEEDDIAAEEQRKIDYAERFFDRLNQLMPNADIVFKKRIHRQELRDLLKQIGEGMTR